MKAAAAAAGLWLLVAAAGAAAQGVWRCGPEGRSYADRPCAEGRAMPAAQQPTPRERSAAARVAARERALADRLRSERLALERARPPGSGLGTLGAGPAVRVPPAKKAPAKPPRPPGGLRPAAAGTSPAVALSSPRRPD